MSTDSFETRNSKDEFTFNEIRKKFDSLTKKDSSRASTDKNSKTFSQINKIKPNENVIRRLTENNEAKMKSINKASTSIENKSFEESDEIKTKSDSFSNTAEIIDDNENYLSREATNEYDESSGEKNSNYDEIEKTTKQMDKPDFIKITTESIRVFSADELNIDPNYEMEGSQNRNSLLTDAVVVNISSKNQENNSCENATIENARTSNFNSSIETENNKNESSSSNEEKDTSSKDSVDETTESDSLLLKSRIFCQSSIAYDCDSNCDDTWLKRGCKKLITFLKATDNQNRNLILRGIELFGDSFVNILLWKSDNDKNFWINMAQSHISSFSQLTNELKLDLEIIINEIQEANRLNRIQT